MPEAIRNKILTLVPPRKPELDPEEEATKEMETTTARTIKLPDNIELRNHQNRALEQWVQNKGRGVFQHATGSGKTITALNIMVRLFEKKWTIRSHRCVSTKTYC